MYDSITGRIAGVIEKLDDSAANDPNLVKACAKDFVAGAIDGVVISSIATTLGLIIAGVVGGIKGKKSTK